MSVLVINRDLSELEYYHQANELYKDMTQLLLRNFGIKTKQKKLRLSRLFLIWKKHFYEWTSLKQPQLYGNIPVG